MLKGKHFLDSMSSFVSQKTPVDYQYVYDVSFNSIMQDLMASLR
jgi:hypothetical protein